jgi:hypothetical protein
MLVYDEIEKILSRSALTAYDRYIDWTGGDTVHDAGVESLITTRIAEKIVAAEEGSYVVCDTPFLWLRRQGLKGHRRQRRGAREPGRIGILLFNRRNQAIVAVEVKRSFVFSQIKGDIEKFRSLLLRHGHLKGGTLKACYSVSIRERSGSRPKSTQELVKATVQRVRKLRGMTHIIVKSSTSKLKRRRISYLADGRRVHIEGFEAVLVRFTLRRPRV